MLEGYKFMSAGAYGPCYQSLKHEDRVLKLVHLSDVVQNNIKKTMEDMYKHYQKLKELNLNCFVKIYDIKFDGYFIYVEMQKVLILDQINIKYFPQLLQPLQNILKQMQEIKICHNDFHMSNLGVYVPNMKNLSEKEIFGNLQLQIKAIDLDFVNFNSDQYCYDEMKLWTNFITLYIRTNKKIKYTQKEVEYSNKLNQQIYNKLKYEFPFWKWQVSKYVFHEHRFEMSEKDYLSLFDKNYDWIKVINKLFQKKSL